MSRESNDSKTATNERQDDRLTQLEITDAELEIRIQTNFSEIKRFEETLENAQKEHKAAIESIKKEIEPLIKHMIISSALIKGISILGAIAGLVLSIIEIIYRR